MKSMLELVRHTQCLLLRHDCVIVPDFGALVVNRVPAQWDEATLTFLPPRREVRFTRHLRHDDGLLVGSYMLAHDTTYPETLRLIAHDVRALEAALEEEGTYEWEGIGTMRLSLGEGYTFEAVEAGVLSPELYGLGRVMGSEFSGDEVMAGAPSAALYNSSKHYTIRLPRKAVDYAVAVACIVAFYFLLAVPHKEVMSSRGGERLASQPSAELSGYQVMAGAPANNICSTKAPQPRTERPCAADSNVETPLSGAEGDKLLTSEPKTQNSPDEEYVVVLASAVSEKNATMYAEMLRGDGLEGIYQAGSGSRSCIYYGHYGTQEEAYAALRELRPTHKAFEQGWVKRVTNE